MEGNVTRFEPPRVFEHTWWGQTEDDVDDARILWEAIPDGVMPPAAGRTKSGTSGTREDEGRGPRER